MLFLGNLAANAGAGCNNHTTAVPFDIPNAAKRLYIESDTDHVQFEIGAGTGDNYDTFVTTAARGARLYGANDPYFVQEAFPVPQIGLSPTDAASAWVGGATYGVDDIVSNDGQRYVCTQAGTSALYGTGPTTIGAFLGDGTCNWRWLGPSGGEAVPNKSVVRIAIWNPTVTACVVGVWILD